MQDPRERSAEISKLKADIPELDELEKSIRILSGHDEKEGYESSFEDIINFLTHLINLETFLLNREKNALYRKKLEELQLYERIKQSIDLSQAVYIKYKIVLQKRDSEIGSSINLLTVFLSFSTFLLLKLEVAKEGTKAIYIYTMYVNLDTYYVDVVFTLVMLYFMRNWIFSFKKNLRKLILHVARIAKVAKILARDIITIFLKMHNLVAIALMIISFLVLFIAPIYILVSIFK